MLRLFHCVFNHATAAVVFRTIGLATAIVAGASTAAALDNRPADETAIFAQAGGQDGAPSGVRASSPAYAQLFGPFEQLFRSSPPDRNRRQYNNPPRARDDRYPANARDTYIQSRDRNGNPGPTYRVLGVAPAASDNRYLSQADRLKLKIAQRLRETPPTPPAQGPLLLAISIAKQTVTLYDAGVPIAVSPVSTGTPSNPTPTGIFSVIEKQWWHRSNLYSLAPMPFMQRITWSGIALHAGDLPGYAASHGCIRLPEDFALRLWGTTKIGARVIITKDEIAPVEIAHARLFVPKAKAEPALELKPELMPGETAPPEKIAPPAIKPRQEEMSLSVDAPVRAFAESKTEEKTEGKTEAKTETTTEATTERPLKRVASYAPSPRPLPFKPVIVTPPGYAGGGPRVIVVPQAQRAAAPPAAADDAVADDRLDDATKDALRNVELVDPDNTVINGTAEVAITRPGRPPETLLLSVEMVPADAGLPPVSAPPVMLASLDASGIRMSSGAMPSQAIPNQATPNTQLAHRRAAPRAAPPAAPVVTLAAKTPPRVLRPGPVSILVSRKDQRMYIRKGFEPLFDVPVTIAKPNEPIGTHVFTAVAPSGDEAALRWMAISLETPPALERAVTIAARAPAGRRPRTLDPKQKAEEVARATLDRLELPQEAVDRISELVSVGATLIVSERSLGRRAAEALDSDFMVLTR